MPVNVYPSSLSGFGDGVIDVTDGLTVSWQFTGEPLKKYRIVIYQNDAVSTQKFDTGTITLTDPFYPNDALGNQRTFYANKITAQQLSSAGIVNGYANGYKLIITETTPSNVSVTQVSASAFITRAKPTLTIDTIETPYPKRDIKITATYAQAQGDAVYNVQWILAEVNNPDDQLMNTGIIETTLLEFNYDGLVADTTYIIKAIVETENGIKVDTGWVEFYVNYELAPSEGLVTLCKPIGSPYMQITWTNRTEVMGKGSGNYSLSGGMLRLQSGGSVVYDQIDNKPYSFAHPWSFVWRGQLYDLSSTITVAQLSTTGETYTLRVNSQSLAFRYGSTVLFSVNLDMLINDQLVVIITPNYYYIKHISREGGTIPATDLYPSTTLYPNPVSRIINHYYAPFSYEQQNITAVRVNGVQNCEFLWVYCGELDISIINNLMAGEWFEPSFDENTYLIATFKDNSLRGYVSGGNGDTLYGSSIYRQEKGSYIMKHLMDTDPGFLIGRDYGIVSNQTYTYYVFQRGGETYTSQPYKSREITPVINSYTLIETQMEEDGFYHVVNYWIVSGNLNSGTISNNNKPQVLENFTKYPIWQSNTQNYMSGTLTALIGKFDSLNNYSDSWELAKEFQALSVSSNPKFLKDMKGNMWMIETNGAVTMTVDDKSALMPIKMSFPWVEVGDANEKSVSVISVPGDKFWEKDEMYLTTVEIDLQTGRLMWTQPDTYLGTTLQIDAAGILYQVESGLVTKADMTITDKGFLTATI